MQQEPSNALTRPWRPSSDVTTICVALAVMLIVGVVMSPVVTAGAAFIDRDDQHYVFEVGNIWSMTWQEAGATFGRFHLPSGTGRYYQPFTALSFMLDAYLTTDWASRAFQFHLTNLLLHVLNVALVFLLVLRLSQSVLWAALCALLFGVHPLQVESVAWVSQRMTLLATLFSLTAVLCYLRYGTTRRFRWFLPVTPLFAAAVLSKPTFLGLPIVLLICDVWPLRRMTWRPVIEKIPLFLILLTCAALHYALQDAVEPISDSAIGGITLIVGNVSSFASRILWPVNLSPFYPVSADPAGLAWPLGITVLLMVILFGSFWKHRPLFVAVAAAVVLVAPALFNAPRSDHWLGDHYLYAVLIGPMIAWAAWIKTRDGGLDRPWGRCLAVALAAVIAIFAVRSNIQSYLWQSNRALYAHTIRAYPQWAFGYVGLVKSYIEEGDIDSALHYAESAVAVDPDDPATQFYLGRVLLLHRDGRSKEAIRPLRLALASDPDWIDCLYHLGLALVDTGQIAEAIERLERARDLQPREPRVRIALGSAYLLMDRPASARGEFQLALKEQNDPTAHWGLAKAWAAIDQRDYARRHLAAAVAQDSRYAYLAARSPALRRFRNEPGFELLIDGSAGGAEPSTEGAVESTPGSPGI